MSNELMTTSAGGLSLISRIAEFQTVAKLFADSGMFSDAKGAAQCFVKIMAGAELGLPPFTAMNAFHVVQGKPTMAANTIAARLKASGKYNYRIVEKSATKCVIDFYEAGEKVYTETWDTDRARRANVKNMAAFPEAMLFARAITSGARAIAPDVVGQFYTPDELGADVDADGNITQIVEPTHAHEPAPQLPSATAPSPAPEPPPIAYKPVSDTDRAAFSAMVDRHNALVTLSATAAQMNDEQKKDFIAKTDALIADINTALVVRELPAIEHDDKVSVRFKRMTRAVNAAIAHDQHAPHAEAQPA